MAEKYEYSSNVPRTFVQDCSLLYVVSIDQLLCLAFHYGWCFLNKISLDWTLFLTTQPSSSKLSDNPDAG